MRDPFFAPSSTGCTIARLRARPVRARFSQAHPQGRAITSEPRLALGGTVAALASAMATNSPDRSAELWMNGACAILTAMTRRSPRHDLLGGTPKSAESARITRTILESSWGIADLASLRSTLTWLRDTGHRAARNPNAADDLGPLGLLACDYVRLIALAGWGYVADYISAEEAWSFIVPAARKLQQFYRSWEELGSAYVRGTYLWFRNSGPGCRQAFEVLVCEPESPWLTVPWETNLGVASLMPPAPVLARPPVTLGVYLVSTFVMVGVSLALWFAIGHGVFLR